MYVFWYMGQKRSAKCASYMLVEQALINSDEDDEITTPISQHNVHIYAGRVLRNASVEGI